MRSIFLSLGAEVQGQARKERKDTDGNQLDALHEGVKDILLRSDENAGPLLSWLVIGMCALDLSL